MTGQPASAPVLWSRDARGVATVTLNRPAVNNAYDRAMLDGVLAAMDDLGSKPGLRAVVIKGAGRHFQCGADLKWADEVRRSAPAAILDASRATATAIDRLNRLPVPTVALIQGGCFGGGTGFASAVDVAIAADNALFAIAEVRWGLAAGIIIPQLNDAMSVRQVRRYALTGERFDAVEARRIGLVHEVVALTELEAAGERVVAALLENAPGAVAETKAIALGYAWGDLDRNALDGLIVRHGAMRFFEEATEGLASFAEKRPARWSPKAR